MNLTAGEASNHTALPVVVIVLLIAAVIYGFGYARAVMHRANTDYKTTKAALPTLRKGFWLAWWAAVRVGFWVVVAVLIMVVWAARDIRGNAGESSRPSPSVSSSHPRR